jgi:hypothetical protein
MITVPVAMYLQPLIAVATAAIFSPAWIKLLVLAGLMT